MLKDSPAEALVTAVRTVASGAELPDPRVLPRVLAQATARPVADPSRALALARLSPREHEALDGICSPTSAEIAAGLRTSERTVKSQVSSIL